MAIITGINTNLSGSAGNKTFGGRKNREEQAPDFTLTLSADTTMEAIVLED